MSNNSSRGGAAEMLSASEPPDVFEVQEMMLGIWRELLPSPGDIELDMDFKALGGDSLFAMNLISRVWDVFAIELSPGLLFDLNNIGDLSEFVANRLSPSVH